MKKILCILLVLIATNAYCQGVKKSGAVKKPGLRSPTTLHQSQGKDSLVLHGQFRTDTAKIIALLYMEDQTIGWQHAYYVVYNFIPDGSPTPMTRAEGVFDDKWAAISRENIVDVKPYNWK